MHRPRRPTGGCVHQRPASPASESLGLVARASASARFQVQMQMQMQVQVQVQVAVVAAEHAAWPEQAGWSVRFPFTLTSSLGSGSIRLHAGMAAAVAHPPTGLAG
ncbi:hypothetical protein E4U21_005982 [Claviceps maximensis]|nr:hypothetical protein E4U21_005982 [Claviceps maximensis]